MSSNVWSKHEIRWPTSPRRWLVLGLVFFLVVGACATETAEPDPDELIAAVRETLAATEGLTFRIQRDGAPVELGEWSIRSVSGVYAAPDSADSQVKIALGGLTVSVGMINIGKVVWQQDPLNGSWSEATGDAVVTVGSVFGPDGLATVIGEDLGEPSFVETTELDDLPGEQLHLVRAALDTARLFDISVGLIPAGSTTADIYVSESGELRRVVIPDPGGQDAWVIDAWAYGPGEPISPPS